MKKFLIKLSYTVLPIWLVLVLTTCYLSLYVIPQTSGDIGRLACIPFGFEYDKMIEKSIIKDTLFQTIYKTEDFQTVKTEVLTVGDSFSQQQNTGYQNYLSEKGVKVVNCFRRLYDSPIQYAYNLLDKNVIDSASVKVMVIEIAERDFETFIGRFDKDKVEVGKQYKESGVSSNSWSLARTRDYLLYLIGWVTPIYKEELNTDLFSSDCPRDLYFYNDDIEKGVSISDGDKVRQVINTVQEKADGKGISLIWLIAPDKYDIYQKYIVDNPYPVKTVNEDIERILGKSPSLMIAKQYLLPLVEKGEKDIFLFNDTHWSYKSCKVIADELYDRLVTHTASGGSYR